MTKCRYEVECDCDFETLDTNQRLEALRVFASTFPLMLVEFVKMTELFHACSIALQRQMSAADVDAVLAKALCEEYAEAVNELNSAFSEVFKLNAELLGKSLRVIGLQANTAAPTTKTMQ